MEIGGDTVVLLGAGASAEAGVPTTREMTAQLAARIDHQSYGQNKLAAALNFVCGALIAYDAAQGFDPFEGLDVERVFAAVELLAERRTLEVSPFVASWHPAVDAWDDLRRTAPVAFDRKFKQALSSPHYSGQIVGLINQLIDSRVTTASSGTTYAALGRRMLGELRDLVSVTQKRVGYLEPLVARGRGRGGLTIATLNYDLGVEYAAEAAGVPLDTGIESWLAGGRWRWPVDGIRLLKLHGSINWVWDRLDHEDGELPGDVVRISEPDEEHENPALVFGNRGKLRAEGPFLGLLAEFEAQLKAASRLVAIGYSFRDDHVNEAVRQWLSEDRARTILVIDPFWPDDYEIATEFQRTLAAHLIPGEWRDPAPFSPRLEIRKETCGEALSRLVDGS